MKRFFLCVALIFSLFIPVSAHGQTTQCEGPAELCEQIKSLQVQLHESKKETLSEKKEDADKTEKLIAYAALMAVILKISVSVLKSYSEFFKTDKGKARIRLISILVGFSAFLLSNIGFGMPVWQAIILAGGGPGALAIHEIMKLIPVLRGEKPIEPESEVET